MEFNLLRVLDENWHQACVTWSGLNGAVNVYFDGQRLPLTSVAPVQGRLNGGGIITLGRYYRTTVEYNMTQVNVWDRVLVPSEIFVNSAGCYKAKGNVKEWDDFKPSIQAYPNHFVQPSHCPVEIDPPVIESEEEASVRKDQASFKYLRGTNKKVFVPRPGRKVATPPLQNVPRSPPLRRGSTKTANYAG